MKCDLCAENLQGNRGEPYDTAMGKVCLRCLKSNGLQCRCGIHREWDEGRLRGRLAS